VVNDSFGYAWYDANKAYISGENNAQNTGSYTRTSPANAKYMRLNVNMSKKNTFQLEEGAVATSYVAYSIALDNKYINYVPNIVEGSSIKTKTVDPTKCTFFVESKNLFDLANVIDDYVMNGNNGNADPFAGNCYLNKYIDVNFYYC
jgi:hypothetical protein